MEEKKVEVQFYRLTEILKRKCQYNIIFGERSNGKTFACLEKILKDYLSQGKQGAIIRRWDLDFKRGRGDSMWSGHIDAGLLNKTEWDGIEFKTGAWTLYKWDEDLNKKVYDNQPFCYSFALSNMEHDKSTSYPNIKNIVFDEFLTRQNPLPDEFILFMNCLSTIIRHRDDVIIFMLGNTVNKDSIYFKEMGLKHIAKMQQGDIEVYEYGDSGLRVAVEYCGEGVRQKKKSDKYFAFDNAKLKMITSGTWELAIYPHLPCKYKPKDIKFRYYIKYDDVLLIAEVIRINNNMFTYIHKCNEIKDPDKNIVYSTEVDYRKNWRRRINGGIDKIDSKIWEFYKKDKVYYQDNEIGEIVRNYLIYCNNYSIIKT